AGVRIASSFFMVNNVKMVLRALVLQNDPSESTRHCMFFRYTRAIRVPHQITYRKQAGFIKGRLLGESKKRKFVRYQLMLDW
ncbi:MAG: hypothetical protein DRH12_19360, partial [Deltaproteobacteria bacterium]